MLGMPHAEAFASRGSNPFKAMNQENAPTDENLDDDEISRANTVDYKAVQEYLILKMANPDEIARLATMMAPKHDGFNLEALIDAALDLSTGVATRIELRRDGILDSMNIDTALLLARRLGFPASIEPGKPNGIPLNNPFVRGVYWKVASRLVKGKPVDPWEYKGADLLEDGFALAEKLTTLDRPALPCSLDMALRFITDENKVAREVLERVYLDSFVIPKLTKEEDDEMIFLKKAANDISNKLCEDNLDEAQQIELNDHLKLVGDNLTLLKERIPFRESFSPGKKIPASCMPWAADLTESWRRPDYVDKWLMMELLWSDIRTHWNIHGGAYREMSNAKKLSIQKMRAGSHKHWGERWKDRTTDFVIWIKKNNNDIDTLSIDTIANMVGTYRETVLDRNPKGYSKGYIVEYTTVFLSELCRYAADEDLDDGIGRTILEDLDEHDVNLAKESKVDKKTAKRAVGERGKPAKKKQGKGYQSLSEYTVIECLNIIRPLLAKKLIAVTVPNNASNKTTAKPKPAKDASKATPKSKRKNGKYVSMRSEGTWNLRPDGSISPSGLRPGGFHAKTHGESGAVD